MIPGVDDGARSFEESCQMLCMAARQGIGAVIATPHYSRKREIKDLEELTERLQVAVRKYYPDFAVYQGQETYYHEGLAGRLQEGWAHTMAGSSYVLTEFDEGASYEEILRGIRCLMNAGYFPILAHVERYLCLRREGRMVELSRNGCLFQMNYDSLKGFGLKYRKDVDWCRKQVREGRIQLLGTDMHRPDYRPPDIRRAIRWLGRYVESDLLNAMVYENPLRIINNEGIN